MINNVTLVGRLSKACELRYSQSGNAVASFTVACNRFGKKDEADFINCIAFKGTAEALANYTDKGSLIGLTGSIQVRTYEKDGQKRWVTEIIASSVQFLDSKKDKGGNQNPNQSNNQNRNNFDDDPFAGKGTEIEDDGSLPF